jgi:hypothetical protein
MYVCVCVCVWLHLCMQSYIYSIWTTDNLKQIIYTLYINILGATSVNITDTPEISTTLAVGLVIGVDVHDTGRNLNFHLQ